MNWQYGLVRNKQNFLYLSEIYHGECHSDSLSIGGESSEEIIHKLEMILKDLKDNLLIIDEVDFEDE